MLGPMRSICWTDHANWTKQQTAAPADVEVKHLRWISEIVADGSEIRSLSGRNCRLADGTSRNPKDRNEIIAQRTKDIEGLAGQVRKFDLDAYLSDCEEAGIAIPWGVGDSVLPPSEGKHLGKTKDGAGLAAGDEILLATGLLASSVSEPRIDFPKIAAAAGVPPRRSWG